MREAIYSLTSNGSMEGAEAKVQELDGTEAGARQKTSSCRFHKPRLQNTVTTNTKLAGYNRTFIFKPRAPNYPLGWYDLPYRY